MAAGSHSASSMLLRTLAPHPSGTDRWGLLSARGLGVMAFEVHNHRRNHRDSRGPEARNPGTGGSGRMVVKA